MGGGLGGGSSNAAFALIGLNKLWNLNRSISRLAEIGATLGSDVPFFLHGPSSICAGRGERVEPIPPPLPKYAVLIFPAMSISTPGVYRRFDEMGLGSREAIEPRANWASWTQWPAERLLPVLVNDLEPPTFSLCPELRVLKDRIQGRIGRTVRMSGSGSTLFTLADEREDAERLATQIWAEGVAAESFRLGLDAVSERA